MSRVSIALLFGLMTAFSPVCHGDVPETVHQLNSSPPRIVVSNQAARLMLIDGPPATVGIPDTGLAFVVNTDWDVFRHRESGQWYILDGGHWLHGSMLSSGDWLATTEIPRDFLTLQVSSGWSRVADAMPPRQSAEPPLPIVISYEPTELIVVEGEMQLEAVGETGLQYVRNTESDLFFHEGRFYYLAAGRWFTTKSVDRKWYAVKSLPGAFAQIPEEHPRARVLVSVPGTEAARRAAEQAAVPERVEVAVSGDGIEVPWFGAPSFVPIEGTDLQRAENTPFQVIQHNNYYYLCHQGAWYAAIEPTGPWRAAREIPEAIYGIPPTDPAFNITFVRLDAFDDSSGRAAYVNTSGYYNRYYNGMNMVYGTGWYHAGYHAGAVYWRYPYSYGYYGAWGSYQPYYYSNSVEIDVSETDWEWHLDGSKRRVYLYGPQNYVGGQYRMPKSNIHQPGGKE